LAPKEIDLHAPALLGAAARLAELAAEMDALLARFHICADPNVNQPQQHPSRQRGLRSVGDAPACEGAAQGREPLDEEVMGRQARTALAVARRTQPPFHHACNSAGARAHAA